MKSLQHVLSEPAPATVNYRDNSQARDQLRDLMDNGGRGNSSNVKSTHDEPAATKLNWVNGVFIPVLLNIWGVIMFLRLGKVVGQAGLLLGSLIIICSNVVTGITAMSLCAICTNGEVKGGGVYFLISRALGPIYGGTIGLLFFVAQAVAVSLYLVGFAEAVVDLILNEGGDYITGSDINDIRLIGIVTATVLFLMSLIGIGWYAKTQTVLLVILIVAISSVFIGAFIPSLPDTQENLAEGFVGFKDVSYGDELRNLGPNFQTDVDIPSINQGFFSVFSVFFPAVTGIMAGANLSGDLDDPSKAIPKGTLYGIGVTFVSYILLLWFIGLVALDCVNPILDFSEGDLEVGDLICPFEELNNSLLDDPNFVVPTSGLLYDELIMTRISLWPYLVYIGVFAATLSSALASLVGAPRILQSVASDKVFPFKWLNFFAVGRGAGNEPIRGYCLTYAITCGCVAIGKLDVIAPIITNFFLISYCGTNYACFLSSMSKAPSWRPSFKHYNKWVALVGALLCLLIMFLIDWITSLVTLFVTGAIFYYLARLNPDTNWGEVDQANKYPKALRALENLSLTGKDHVKTFRPQFLVLTGDIFSRTWLVKFVSLFQTGGGLMLCTDIVSKRRLKSFEKSLWDEYSETSSISAQGTTTKEQASVKQLFNDESSQNSAPPQEETSGDDAVLIEDNSDNSTDPENRVQTARQLAKQYETIKNIRSEGDAFLNNGIVWAGRRCKGAFFDAVVASSLFRGFQKALQLGGIGKLRPNAAVIGFKSDYLSRKDAEIADYEKVLRSVLAVEMGLLVVRDDELRFDIKMTKNAMSFLPKNPFLRVKDLNDDLDKEVNMPSSLYNEEFNDEIKDTKQETTLEEKAKPEETQTFADGRSKNSKDFKERIQKYRANDKDFMNKFEAELPSDVPGEYIDVWWLADDGGLTMLLPELLVQNPLFKDKKLRVMAVTNKFQSPEETSRLKKAEMRMVHLLHKFRINAVTKGIDLNLELPVDPATQKRFEQCMGLQMSDLDEKEKASTHVNLRLSEEIRKHSRNSSVVFMIMPVPETSLRPKLYTTWLDMFSYSMPPMVMMRGNNKAVLTFFC